ncbi:MAG: hypothetical protein U0872_12450 [Planctomycetaceae bacterium]
MWTGISALLNRAMQLDARQLRTHLFRLAFVAFIYFSLLIAQLEAMSRGAPGLHFLQGIVYLNAFFITLAGVSFFASAITEEKEENTLGLLQMAGIGPLSVLLGKSTSRLIQALLLLIVQFPFTLLSITLGGVTMQQVVAAYVALLAYLIGLANLALVWSVVCRRTGSAAGLTSLVLLVYFIAPWLAGHLLANAWASPRGWQTWVIFALSVINNMEIFRQLSHIMATGFNQSVFSTQVITNLVFGAVCFCIARLIFIPFTQDAGQQTESRGLVLSSASNMKLFSAGRCWNNPLVWKDYHFLTGGYSLAIVKLFAYGGLFGLIAWVNYYNSPYPQLQWDVIYGQFATCLTGFLILEASIFAARIFHDEIRLQTMSSLLMLPRTIPYLAYSKALGCLLGLLPALFWLVITLGIMGVGDMIPAPARANGYSGPFALLLYVITNPNLWAVLLVLSFFLHLTSLLSLFVKWGALPLAITVMVMMTCVCPIVPMMFGLIQNVEQLPGAELVATLMLILVNLVASFVLEMMIGARLQEIGST